MFQTKANRGRKTKPGGKAGALKVLLHRVLGTHLGRGIRTRGGEAALGRSGEREAGGDWHLIFEVHRGCHSSLTRLCGADSDTNQLVFNQCNRTRWAFFEATVAGAQL